MKKWVLIISILLLSVVLFSAVVSLELLTHPGGADVIVDDVWRGETPQTVQLSPGKHDIVLNKRGYREIQKTMDVRMPNILEYNLLPEQKVTESFPLVLYLLNYQQSDSRKILYRENEDKLIKSITSRLESMGFSVSVERPDDEFDLIMDTQSIYDMLHSRHPDAKIFMLVDASWSYSSFREKKVTRLEVITRLYDPKTSITLGNYNEASESIGVMGPEIVMLESVEKITQNFLDNIGDYMVERVAALDKKPIIAGTEKDGKFLNYALKTLERIKTLKTYDNTGKPATFQTVAANEAPLNFLIVIDRSGSNEKNVEAIRSQVESIISELPDNAEWALMGFDDTIELIQGFTKDYNRWLFAKDKIYANGMTRLYDALYNSGSLMMRRNGLKVIILLSDGIDSDYYDTANGSIKTKEEALYAIKRSGSILYPIGIADKNYDTFLEKLTYDSASKYYKTKNQSEGMISKAIVEDVLLTSALVKTEEMKEPIFSINGHKFEEEADTRFLIPAETQIKETTETEGEMNLEYPDESGSTITTDIKSETEAPTTETVEDGTEEATRIIIEESTDTTEKSTDTTTGTSTTESPGIQTPKTEEPESTDVQTRTEQTTKPATPVKEETSEKETEEKPPQKESETQKATNVSQTPEQSGEPAVTEKATEVQTETKTTSKSDKPATSTVTTEEQKKPEKSPEEDRDDQTERPEKTEPASTATETGLQKEIDPKDLSKSSDENVFELPDGFSELLKLTDISLYDMDGQGNLAWLQGEIVYFFSPEDKRLAGIDISNTVSKISLDYPQITLLEEQASNKMQLRTLEIRKDAVIQLSTIEINSPVSEILLLNGQSVAVGYEDGKIKLFDHSGDLRKEVKLTSGVMNNAVFDEYGTLIFSTTTGRAGWLKKASNTVEEIKVDKPVVGLAPFDVDKGRFLIVDASGAVHFQRFSESESTKRNLNRGIVLEAQSSEASNLLFAIHWDKTLRGYRVFDLKEVVTMKSKKGLESFQVGKYGEEIAVRTTDNELYCFAKNYKLPTNLEAIYSIQKIEKSESTQEKEPGEQKKVEKEAPATETTKATEIDVEHTEMDLGSAEKKDTGDSTELEKTEPEEKEEEIAVVVDGDVVMGDLQEDKDSPIPESKKKRELTPEEKQGLTSVYGGWKAGVAYEDFGYVLAGDSEMWLVNPLLEKTKKIPYTKSRLLDMDISKYNLVLLLFEDRLELWDMDVLYSSDKPEEERSYKFPIQNGKTVKFSRNGKKALILRNDGTIKMISIDFTTGRNFSHENRVTAINANKQEAESFIFGDNAGNIGLVDPEGKSSVESVSENAITHVFWYKDNLYWVDSASFAGIVGGNKQKITGETIKDVYAADIDKEWILFGTETGALVITDKELKNTGRTSINKPVLSLTGYKENMLSIDVQYGLKSWNLIGGTAVATKPVFDEAINLFSNGKTLGLLDTNNIIYEYNPANDQLSQKRLADSDFEIQDALKRPLVVHNQGVKYYPVRGKTIPEEPVEVFVAGNVNTSEDYFLFWENDYLTLYNIEENETLRTFKFGEGNNVSFATMKNDRLFFFFNNSMGITNPYNPGQVIVIDLTNEGINEVLRTFYMGEKLGILDQNGVVHYYLIFDDKMTMPVELGMELEEAYYNEEQMLLIGKNKDKLLLYSTMDNDIKTYTFEKEIKDFSWTQEGIYILTEDGKIWKKDY